MSFRKKRISWEEFYFKNSETIPELRKITDRVTCLQRFQYRSLKFVRPLSPYRYDSIARVWEVEADLCTYAIKLFKPYTDLDAECQRIRLPRSNNLNLPKVIQDASPFQHEVQLYERIGNHCAEGDRPSFPAYYGTIKIAPPDQPDTICEGIVMDMLRTDALYRHLDSSEIPSYLLDVTVIFQTKLKTLNLPHIEEMWYSQTFLERAKKLTSLHAMGIIHGDVKNDCFQISDYPHDVALHDFSLAYTFASEKPCMMNGCVKLIPLKHAAEIDLHNAATAVMERAKNREFRAYAGTLLKLSPDNSDAFLRVSILQDQASKKLDLIILLGLVYLRQPFFPSLPSILPFLEPIMSDKSATWAFDTAKRLRSYETIWYFIVDDNREHPIDANRGFDSAVIVAFDGSVLDCFGRSPLQESKGSVTPQFATVALFPSRWKSAVPQGETLCRQIFSLITPRTEPRVLVIEECHIGLGLSS